MMSVNCHSKQFMANTVLKYGGKNEKKINEEDSKTQSKQPGESNQDCR